jgi:hypothetical protein
LHAGFTAYASPAVEIDYAVIAAEESRHRAYSDAGRVLALIAPQNGKKPSRVRVFAFLYVLDPGAECTNGHLVL